MTDVALGVIILGPALITFFLKSNAALGFLTLCLSFVLSVSVIGDLKRLLSQTNLSVTESTLGLILLLAPLAITLVITHGFARRGLKFYLQILAALLAGGLLALSLGPILAHSTQFDITSSKFWDELQNIQSIIIGAGATLSMVLVWLGALKHKSKKH